MSTEIITLTIEAKGEIISSNFPIFAEIVRNHLATFNRALTTDDEFGQADKDAKAIASAESALKAAKVKALSDAEDLNALFEQIDGLSGELAAARLDLTKQIAAQKEKMKDEIIEEFLATFDIDSSLARKHYLPGLLTEIKGKRTINSMRTACLIYATTQQALIAQCRKVLDSFESAHGVEMTMDRRTLELEKPEGLEAELRRRFEAKRAAEEKRLLEAEAAKARAETAKAQAALEASKQPVVERGTGGIETIVGKPAPLPTPPKVGGIPTGAKAAPPGESNVVPFNAKNPPQATIGEAEEWKQMTATVIAAFGLIKEHRERLIHDANKQRVEAFGAMVNDSWKASIRMEVAP